MEITLESVQKFLSESADSPEVQAYLDTFKKGIDAKNVSEYLEGEGKQLKQSIVDKENERFLNVWKERHLDELVENEIMKRNPPKTEDQKRIMEIEKKLAEVEAEKLRERMLNSTIKFFAEHEALKGYAEYAPTLAGLVISSTEEATNEKAQLLLKAISGIGRDMVSKDIAGMAKKPEGGSSQGIGADFDTQMARLAEAHAKGDVNALQQMNLLRRLKQKEQQR